MTVRQETLPDRPPPAFQVGIVGWARQNLFSGPINTVLTLIFMYFIYQVLRDFIQWGVLDADWFAEDRFACESGGACWAIIRVRFSQFVYGFYPLEMRWRLHLSAIGLPFALAPLLVSSIPYRRPLLLFASAYPFLSAFIISGVDTQDGTLLGVALVGLIAPLALAPVLYPKMKGAGILSALSKTFPIMILFWVWTVSYEPESAWRIGLLLATFLLMLFPLLLEASASRGRSIGLAVLPFVMALLMTAPSFASGAPSLTAQVIAVIGLSIMLNGLVRLFIPNVSALIAGIGSVVVAIVLVLLPVYSVLAMVLAPLVFGVQSGFAALGAGLSTNGFALADATKYGGLMLTIIVGLVGIAGSLPIGVALALGRRSDLPVVRIICVGFIEFIRGVPLITLLFTASVMLPLFMPQGVTFALIPRVLIVVTLFASGYMAEVIRGGLQSLSKGQYEAGDAMGLTYWQSMLLIILPQALKVSIPAIVNTFIGLFKDTTLVLIIGLLDLLGVGKAALSDTKWVGLATEVYLFVALLFFIFCFSMSRYSIWLERQLATGHKS